MNYVHSNHRAMQVKPKAQLPFVIISIFPATNRYQYSAFCLTREGKWKTYTLLKKKMKQTITTAATASNQHR